MKCNEACIAGAWEYFILVYDANNAITIVEKWTIDHMRPKKKVKLTGDNGGTDKAPAKGHHAKSKEKEIEPEISGDSSSASHSR